MESIIGKSRLNISVPSQVWDRKGCRWFLQYWGKPRKPWVSAERVGETLGGYALLTWIQWCQGLNTPDPQETGKNPPCHPPRVQTPSVLHIINTTRLWVVYLVPSNRASTGHRVPSSLDVCLFFFVPSHPSQVESQATWNTAQNVLGPCCLALLSISGRFKHIIFNTCSQSSISVFTISSLNPPKTKIFKKQM